MSLEKKDAIVSMQHFLTHINVKRQALLANTMQSTEAEMKLKRHLQVFEK